MTSRAAAVLAIALLVAACGGDDDTAAPSPTTAPETTVTTEAQQDAEVVAAYRGFWDAYLAAADPMDPAHPDLERFATGASLDRVRESFADHFTRGEVIRGQVQLSPSIEDLSDDSAAIRDCYLDQTHVFDAATGDQIDEPGEATFEVVAVLIVDGGTWKVSTLDKVGDGCER